MDRVRSKASRPSALVVALATVCAALVVPAVQSAPAGAASATIERPEGAGPPVAASGMGTQAALDNPTLPSRRPEVRAYGRFDTAVVGGGPVCVKAWKAGADNGGATAQGVTKDRITVVAVMPNDEQLKTDPVKPNHRPDRYRRARTWTRSTTTCCRRCGSTRRGAATSRSSSSRRPAVTKPRQRADLVAIKAMKPFAVFNVVEQRDLDVLETETREGEDPRHAAPTTATDRPTQQAPYRWGPTDNQAAARSTPPR